MEARLLSSDLLGNCGVFWEYMEDEVEELHLHLGTITYGETVSYSGREE